MRKINLLIPICFLLFYSCGNGILGTLNMRPKPWLHPYVPGIDTGIDTLINIDGYYLSTTTDTVYLQETYSSTIIKSYYEAVDHPTDTFRINKFHKSILFYKNGLCAALNSRIGFRGEERPAPTLDTLFSNKNFSAVSSQAFYKSHTSWGTYQICDDTIKAYLIDDVSGMPETRKNVITQFYLIKENRGVDLIYISNSSKEAGYKKSLQIADAMFYPLIDKLNFTECPYLEKDWFYKKDKIK